METSLTLAMLALMGFDYTVIKNPDFQTSALQTRCQTIKNLSANHDSYICLDIRMYHSHLHVNDHTIISNFTQNNVLSTCINITAESFILPDLLLYTTCSRFLVRLHLIHLGNSITNISIQMVLIS